MIADYALKNSDTKGRKHQEKLIDHRYCFQRDRDRVLHSRAFRRLDKKTQVLVAGSGDHFRTRLTHTLEVSQIARDLARNLNLNEDLCEVIALAHDLGHSPFGHAGESALDEIMKNFGLHFEHNEQSLRVVTELEQVYPDFDGLNLSLEVLEGLIKHQTAFDQQGKVFEKSAHLEAQVVNIADELAYTCHDLDDGVRLGLISLKDLENFEISAEAMTIISEKYGEIDSKRILVSRMISVLTYLMVSDLVENTEKNLKENGIKTLEDVKNYQGYLASFSPKMKKLVKELRQFLYENFYLHPTVMKEVKKGQTMIKKLFQYYFTDPSHLPEKYFKEILNSEKNKKINKNEKTAIVVKDYIAGMTDLFLIKEFQKI